MQIFGEVKEGIIASQAERVEEDYPGDKSDRIVSRMGDFYPAWHGSLRSRMAFGC